jgi:hypothetical protein
LPTHHACSCVRARALCAAPAANSAACSAKKGRPPVL